MFKVCEEFLNTDNLPINTTKMDYILCTEEFITNCSGNVSTPTNSTSSQYARNEDLAKIEIIVQSVIFAMAVLGNGTVLVALTLQRLTLTRMHVLMLHLCIADLFVAFGSVLPQLAWDITNVFHGGVILCKLVKYMQTLAIYASSYVLVMTAIDRYIAICHPFLSRRCSSKIVQKMVFVAWALSFVFSIPQMFIFSYEKTSYGVYNCWATFDPEWTMPLYITVFTVLVYIIPSLILIVCYGGICVTVWKCNRVGERLSGISKRIRSIKRKDENEAQKEFRNGGQPPDTISNKTEQSLELAGNSKRSKGTLEVDTTYRSRSFDGRRSSSCSISQAKLKTIRLTLTVILCYAICWTPFFVAQMWAAYDINAPFYGAAYTIILLLASLNSCTNPWIYLFFSNSVFRELKLCFTRLWRS